jgi:small subunit ribosomal protein S19
MSRSKWKGAFIDNSLKKKFCNVKCKVWSRKSIVPYELIKKFVYIHNGKIFKKIYVNREKVGYKLGEFTFTRNHFVKKKKNKKPLKK